MALLRCVAALDDLKLESDQAVGVTIVKRALEEPIRQIVVNAGVEGADAQRFNAATEEYLDLIEAGIIDPTKVTRTAQQNAASIAGLMITTECVIADKPEDDKKMGGARRDARRHGRRRQVLNRQRVGWGAIPVPIDCCGRPVRAADRIEGRVPGNGGSP